MTKHDPYVSVLAKIENVMAECKAHGIPAMIAIGVGDRHYSSRGFITDGLDLIDMMITMCTDARDLARKNNHHAIADLMEHLSVTIKLATETEAVTERSQ